MKTFGILTENTVSAFLSTGTLRSVLVNMSSNNSSSLSGMIKPSMGVTVLADNTKVGPISSWLPIDSIGEVNDSDHSLISVEHDAEGEKLTIHLKAPKCKISLTLGCIK